MRRRLHENMTLQDSPLAGLRFGPSGDEHLVERTRLWLGQSTKTELFQRQRFGHASDGLRGQPKEAG